MMATRLAIAAALLMVAVCAQASTGAQGGEHQLSNKDWINLGASVFNFGLFVYLFWRFAGPPLRDFLVNRRTELVEAMSAAARAREEGERVKAEYQRKASELEDTRQAMVEEIRALARADRDRILADAEAVAARMKGDAERAAGHDLEKAKRELRAEAARLAAELAVQRLEQQLDDDKRRSLVDDFVEALGRS